MADIREKCAKMNETKAKLSIITFNTKVEKSKDDKPKGG
jgi:hypothetical protein